MWEEKDRLEDIGITIICYIQQNSSREQSHLLRKSPNSTIYLQNSKLRRQRSQEDLIFLPWQCHETSQILPILSANRPNCISSKWLLLRLLITREEGMKKEWREREEVLKWMGRKWKWEGEIKREKREERKAIRPWGRSERGRRAWMRERMVKLSERKDIWEIKKEGERRMQKTGDVRLYEW